MLVAAFEVEENFHVREFCVSELCIVMHCDVNWATDALVTL